VQQQRRATQCHHSFSRRLSQRPPTLPFHQTTQPLVDTVISTCKARSFVGTGNPSCLVVRPRILLPSPLISAPTASLGIKSMSVLLELGEAGDIVIDLLVDYAPHTCENFLKLYALPTFPQPPGLPVALIRRSSLCARRPQPSESPAREPTNTNQLTPRSEPLSDAR